MEIPSLENSLEPLRTSFQGHECVVVESQSWRTVCTILGSPVPVASCKTVHSSQFTFVTPALCWSETLVDSKYPKETPRCNKVWPCGSTSHLQSGRFIYESSSLCRVWLKKCVRHLYSSPKIRIICMVRSFIFPSHRVSKTHRWVFFPLCLFPFFPTSAKVKEGMCTGSILD